MSMSSSSEGTRSTRQATPAARASARWRSQLPGPKLGAIASGGVSSRPLVPVPCRSGTITTSGGGPSARLRALSSASSSAGSSAGQSPGTHSTRSMPSASARRTPSAAAADWPPRPRPRRRSLPARARPAATDRSRVTTIVRSIASVCASARSTSATIAPASSRRSASATLAPRRCLARAKRLTGRIAAVRTARAYPVRPSGPAHAAHGAAVGRGPPAAAYGVVPAQASASPGGPSSLTSRAASARRSRRDRS